MKKWSSALLCAMFTFTLNLQAQEDMTSLLPGASCAADVAYYWQVTTDGNNGTLQCDTWSSRGSKDGSDMTTPFMECITGNKAPLNDVKLRHETISNVPNGKYRVSMLVRCYDEAGRNVPNGATLYANGATCQLVSSTTSATTSTNTVTATEGLYNNSQSYIVGTLSAECEVSDGTLEVGLDITGANYNWVAWKNVTLTLLEGGAPALKPGTYFIRDAKTGQYICAGGQYGITTVLGPHAIPITVEKGDNGCFLLDAGYTNSNGRHNISGDNGVSYVEGNPTQWTIQGQKDGTFTIYSQQDKMYLLGTKENPTPSYSFITESEMRQLLLEGKETDATCFIADPRFDMSYQNGCWTGDYSKGGYSNNRGGNYCAERWNANNWEVSQTIAKLPNGRYRITAQGYYRYNNTWENTSRIALEMHEDGSEKLFAMLFANDQSTPIQSIASECDKIAELGLQASNYGMPHSMGEAAQAMAEGLYSNNSVEVDVTEHELTIGIRKSQQEGCDWTIWDNFELTLLSLGDNTGFDPDAKPDEEDTGGASPENPVDMTARLANPDFKSASGWKGSPSIVGSTKNRLAEKWYGTFDYYQELSDLPNGWYKITAQGCYRYGDIEYEQQYSYDYGNQECVKNQVYAMYTIPYATITRRTGQEKLLAKLYANNVETPLPSIFDYAHEAPTHQGDKETEFGWILGSTNGASEAFLNGDYPVELIVPVINGKLRLGFRKSLGYKNDWAIMDNVHLYYIGKKDFVLPKSIEVPETDLKLVTWETRQLEASVMPIEAADKTITWATSNSSIVTCTTDGKIQAVANGTATLTASMSVDGETIRQRINVTVTSAQPASERMIINEIEVANIDQFVDPSSNYGGFVELYNPTDEGYHLRNYYITDDPEQPQKFRLNTDTGVVPAHGYLAIWFDHNDAFRGNVNFKLDMDGGTIYIYDQNGNELVSQTYPPAISRVSYARTTDGGNNWAFTGQPTPGASNSGSQEMLPVDSYTRLDEPSVSHESQLFTAPFATTVIIPEGATLRYTTDGSTPTLENGSTSTDGLIYVDGTTILRLRLFKDGALPSPVKTLSYIFRDKDYMLPVLSVVGDPKNFYSDELGVFTTGTASTVNGNGLNFKCNWNMEWERPVAFNYFTLDGKSNFSQEVDIERCGGWSRSWYPFSFKLKATSQYEGKNFIGFPFFSEKPYIKNKVLQVRNGGNDLLCRIKDAAIQHIASSSGFHLDYQDYLPVHSFINGQYQGMMNIREPNNKHHAYANYAYGDDEIDMMEIGGGISVKAGSADAFYQWQNLARQAWNDDVYEQIKEIADVDEFCNYMAAQLFLGGDDWPGNNCKGYKGHDGKFHIVFFDTDQTLRYDGYAFTHLDGARNYALVSIFYNMLQNETFRRQFIDTYSIVAGSVYEPVRCHRIIDAMAEEMAPALALEGGEPYTTAGHMKDVITESRRETMMQALSNWSYSQLGGDSGLRVKLSTNPQQPDDDLTSAPRPQSTGVQPTLLINGLDVPTARFDGTLFEPVVVSAMAPEGYTFKGWVDEKGKVVSSDAEYELTGDCELVATFEPMTDDTKLIADIAMPIKVNEVSAGNTLFINDQLKRNDWFELYNPTDTPLDVAGLYVSDDLDEPLKYQIPATDGTINTVIPAGGHLVIWADKLEASTQLHASFKLSNTDGSIVLATSSGEFVSRNKAYFDQHPDLRGFVDGLAYVEHRGDASVGRFPDGGKTFYAMQRPTIDRRNTILSVDEPVGEDVCYMLTTKNLFDLALTKGWNWMSHNINFPIAAGSLSTKAKRIMGDGSQAQLDGQGHMGGTLSWLEAGKMYKVEMNGTDDYQTTDVLCNPAMPITLVAGQNWLGYPISGTESLSKAFAASDYKANNGDYIIGQGGFSVYEGGQWIGTLSSLEQGQGYVLYSQKSQKLRFHDSSNEVKLNRKVRRISALEKLYSFDRQIGPDVMGVIGEMQLDGIAVQPEAMTLLAYVGNECRGACKWVDNKLFLNVYGTAGERVIFYALPAGVSPATATDDQWFTAQERLTLATAVEGKIAAPRVFTLKPGKDTETGITDIAVEDGAQTSGSRSTITGYYTLSGTLAARRLEALTPGVYIARYADGTYRKAMVK